MLELIFTYIRTKEYHGYNIPFLFEANCNNPPPKQQRQSYSLVVAAGAETVMVAPRPQRWTYWRMWPWWTGRFPCCRPLLVFSHISSTMMQPSLSLSLSALAAKTGAGGKKRPLLLMPPPPPTGEGDTEEIEEFRRRRPNCKVYVDRAARDGSTDVQG